MPETLILLLSSLKWNVHWFLENGLHFPLYGTVTYALLVKKLPLCSLQLPTYPEPDTGYVGSCRELIPTMLSH